MAEARTGEPALRAPERLAFVQGLARERAGIAIAPDKEYFVETRLEALARRRGLAGSGEVVRRLMADPEGGLAFEAVESMTVQETLFFRDMHPFTTLRDVVMPGLLDHPAGPRELVIWSAGCATGQEPYSIAMVLRDRYPDLVAAGNLRIVGTDLSGTAVDRAREGRYTHMEVNRGLPAASLVRHFDEDGTGWRIRAGVRAMVELRRGNLTSPMAPVAAAHVIFARYVLMYLHLEARRAILAMFRRTLAPGGMLVIGATETLLGVDEHFERCVGLERNWYRPRGRAA